MTDLIYDPRQCALGEGPLWHPERKQLFWFDILGKRLLSLENGKQRHWQFGEHVSAAGWVDRNTLLIASESGLFRFDIRTGEQVLLAPLEADNSVTRSNDGRADPWGGFWIGTMGKSAEPGAGAIYRWYQGQLTQIVNNITITNAICFSPDHSHAYYSDTVTQTIVRQDLDANGWPNGEPKVFIDLRAQGLNPDGAVVDAGGCLWNAQWGASRVARYSADGDFLSAIDFPTPQISCPAFGGDTLSTLFATSAAVGLPKVAENSGQTFFQPGTVAGQMEHRVIL